MLKDICASPLHFKKNLRMKELEKNERTWEHVAKLLINLMFSDIYIAMLFHSLDHI